MRPRLWKSAYRIRRSLWARPFAIILLALAGGIALPRMEKAGYLRALGWMATDASPAAVRELLLAGVGGLATILAVGFSMTLLMVQLASPQYSPRLLRLFMGDRITQFVLGTYVATLVFLVLVLRAIPASEAAEAGFVPRVSVSVAMTLALGCLGLLAFFLHHTTRSVDAASIVARVGKETLRAIHELPSVKVTERRASVPLRNPTVQVLSNVTGYVQLIDEHRMLLALRGICASARLEVRTGDFLLPGVPLITLSAPTKKDLASLTRRIHRAIAVGSERTIEDDVLYGTRRLVDVALRALSPAVNDVTTAVMAVNELAVVTQAIAATGKRGVGWRAHPHEDVTLWVRAFGLEDHLAEAYSEIPHAAREHPRVIGRLLETLGQVARAAENPEIVSLLSRCAQGVLDAVDERVLARRERDLIDERRRMLDAAFHHVPVGPDEPEPLH